MTPDLSARVAALEALVLELAPYEEERLIAAGRLTDKRDLVRLMREIPVSPPAAPPPPAAAPEPDVARGSERVRDYLRRALSDVDQETSIFLVGEALRLLQCAPHPDAEPARTALPDVTWVPVMQQAAARLAPCQPPAAPCADEVEIGARAVYRHNNELIRGVYTWDDAPEGLRDEFRSAISAILTAISPLRQAERERAWRDGAEAMQEACKRGVLGGRFLHDQAPPAQFARECAEMLDRLPLPPMGGADAK